jgi:hypothetical protein
MRALLSAFGSIDSAWVALSMRTTFSSFDFLSDFRFSVTIAGGGVVERGGVALCAFDSFVVCV